jgi:hypothetical protein
MLRLSLLLLIIVALTACGAAAPPAATIAPTRVPIKTVTVVGYTEATTGKHISLIEVKDVPSGRFPFSVIGYVKEGTKVPVLAQDENDALIIAPNGAHGYISVDFIQE